jgi:hypothetical protein
LFERCTVSLVREQDEQERCASERDGKVHKHRVGGMQFRQGMNYAINEFHTSLLRDFLNIFTDKTLVETQGLIDV